MGRTRSGRLLRAGIAVALLAFALTGCSTQEVLRFGWPKGVTDQATVMRELWTASCLAALAVGALVWGLTFWVCAFHRRKSADEIPKQIRYNLPLEVVYTVIPFLIIAVLFFYTVVVQNDVERDVANPDVTIDVTGFQWNWEFQYADVNDQTTGAPVSTLGTTDEIPVLVLPVDQVVRINLGSHDVVHSFWVPDFLFKRDVIPGKNFGYDNEFEVTIRETGAFVGRCAELCGIYHSRMNFEVRAVTADQYTAYTAARASGMSNADALRSIGEPGLAQSTTPFDTDRTRRAASGK